MGAITIYSNQEFVALPYWFIDDHMPLANATFTVVYLYVLRHAGIDGFSTELAAGALQMLESDVVKALRFWEEAGLLSVDEKDGDFTIRFLQSHKEITKPSCEPVQLQLVPSAKPSYTVEELEIYQENCPEIASLFTTAENLLGKMLTYNDLNTLFAMYDWLRLPVEVIEILLIYCTNNKHRSMRYIEKVAIDWADNGIDNPEKADAYIQAFNKSYREILKALGQSSRNPTAAELKLMKKWLDEFSMPLDIILEACDKTVMQIGQPKLSYVDKILVGWKEKNVKTIDDIKTLDTAFLQKKKGAKEKKQTATASAAVSKPNRFVNFKQRDWDYDQIEKMAQQNLVRDRNVQP